MFRLHHSNRFLNRHRICAIRKRDILCTADSCKCRCLNTIILKIFHRKNLLWRIKCDLLPLMQKQNPTAICRQFLDLLLYHQNRDPRLCQLLNRTENFLASLRIKLGSRLIKHYHIRSHDEHTRDCNTLHLTT